MIKRTTVILADDHPIVLAGLRNLIESADDLELVGEATTGLAALKLINERQPDVAVLDISMPELNGIVLSRRLANESPAVRVLLLTLHEDRAYVNQALQNGVRGYVLKKSAAENLIHAIRAILVGGIYVDPSITAQVFDGRSSRRRRNSPLSGPGAVSLTDRETDVLRLTALGFTNKEIASKLDVGVKSIETFKSRGLEKLNLKSRAQLVRYASIQGWLAEI